MKLASESLPTVQPALSLSRTAGSFACRYAPSPARSSAVALTRKHPYLTCVPARSRLRKERQCSLMARHPLCRAAISSVSSFFGDTGCRIKLKKHGDYDTQDCKHGWPYAKIALHAAATNPDLVIHVGDYVYREAPCPAGNTDCSNSPYGYGWESWNADFFEPSAPLLAVAPWILVRGNHETFDRAGDGWFRFLDHGKPPNECEKFGSSFVASFDDLGFVVLDSAEAADPNSVDVDEDEDQDQSGSDDLVVTLKSKYQQAGDNIPSPTWLLTHRPFNAVRMHKVRRWSTTVCCTRPSAAPCRRASE
jgi:Calcineurin-like phosphoesterase